MPVLAVADLEKYYGAERVLAGVNLEVETGQKVALVGRNGCGKTTLLRIIAGLDEADRGRVAVARGALVGFLGQTCRAGAHGESLWAEMESVFAELKALGQEAERVAAAMGESPALMERYARLQGEFERQGGYTFRSRIERVLRGVGFGERDWHKPVEVLSGGELTRAALSRMLLREPDLILLDEPTNHLDLWAVAWLEEYLASYRGAVLIVSHDRYLLDRVAGRVCELSAGIVTCYSGNYTAYRTARDAEHTALSRAREIQEREMARKERLIRESPADERHKRQARSIAKGLERTRRVAVLPAEEPAMRVALVPARQSGRIVLEVEQLAKAFPGRVVLGNVTFRLEHGEKVGIIGPNGSGKTTLLRLLLGREQADGGAVRLGQHVQVGYFTQDEAEPGGGTVFSQMQEAGAGDDLATRRHLARFLFRGDEVWKNVADLSGGERRRLALAVLTLSRASFLLLDEPTNHLDLPSIEALEEALRSFPGTVLVVSHDRYFLGRVTDRLLALVDGELLPFPAYEAYAAWHAAEQERTAALRTREIEQKRARQQEERLARQSPVRDMKRRAKLAAALEAALAAKEDEKAGLLGRLTTPEVTADFVALREISARLAALEEEIADLYLEWEACLNES